MIQNIRVKICGLTAAPDVAAAVEGGADYLGFILHPQSPRHVSLAKAQELMAAVPTGPKKVGVVVYSSFAELAQYQHAGFDHLQVHFPNDLPFFEVVQWTELFTPQQLWLAPRVPPGRELDVAFLPLATTFLLDTYHPQHPGGTGQTGDWATFARLQDRYQRIAWMLAGGLSPDNIVAAVRATGARQVDVNSGVESAPGVKDHTKLRALFAALQTLAAA